MLPRTKSTKQYAIAEIFYSLQGEGFHTGTPAVFVRFAGCNLSCPFCDTDFSVRHHVTADEIVARASACASRMVVLTGGEPSLQVDDELIAALKRGGFRIHVETNGTHALPAGIDWVTCSPKDGPEGMYALCVDRIDELKVVYQGQDLGRYDMIAARHRFLQPCSNANVAETVQAVLADPRWRLSLQTHIIIGIE